MQIGGGNERAAVRCSLRGARSDAVACRFVGGGGRWLAGGQRASKGDRGTAAATAARGSCAGA